VPGAVRSITLQDAVPNGKSSSTDPTTYLAQAFDRYVALCQADAVCAQAFPNLPGTYEALWQHYRNAPWGTYFAGQCSYQRFTVDPGSELSKRTRPAFSGIDDRGLPSAHGRPLGTRRP
jgi:hypothetical protein